MTVGLRIPNKNLLLNKGLFEFHYFQIKQLMSYSKPCELKSFEFKKITAIKVLCYLDSKSNFVIIHHKGALFAHSLAIQDVGVIVFP